MGLHFKFKSDSNKDNKIKKNQELKRKPILDSEYYEGKIWFKGFYYDIDIKTKTDILNDIHDLNEEEKEILNSIIFNSDLLLTESLKSDGITHLPLIGNFSLDFGKRYVEKNMNKVNEWKETIKDRKEYSNKMRELYKEGWKNRNIVVANNNKLESLKTKNKKKYEELCKTMGKIYADTYIYSMSLIEVIPFDIEYEKAYQRLNNV